MAEVVNLRIARKRAARSKSERRADENRQVHGISKSERELAAQRRQQQTDLLDQHRIERGDRR